MNTRRLFIMLAAFIVFCGAASAQIFYKIEGNGLEKPSYIFGTHHLAPLSILDGYDMDSYFNQVDQVVAELDLTQGQMAIAQAMQSHMLAPADSTLSKVFSPEDYAIVNEAFEKYKPLPFLELAMFEAMKPAVVSTNIMVGIMAQLLPDFNPEAQLDTYFMTTGQNLGKKIIGLETPEFQAIQLFDVTPISQQAEDLVELLKDPQKSMETAQKLNDAYLTADLNALVALDEEEEEDEFEKIILDNRNAEWLTKIPGIMADGPALIVVGALHLPKEKGVLKGLQEKGYTVTPIYPKKD